MGEFDKILFNKLRLVKIKQLHTQLVKLIFLPSRWEKRKINHLFPSAHNCNSWFSLVPHGRRRLRVPTFWRRSVDFQVTIRLRFLRPSLSHVWHRSGTFNIYFGHFANFQIMKYFRCPVTSQLKSFLILRDFCYQHSKNNILLFTRLSEKSSVTIRGTKIMFSVKQIEI